jgi:hypothetical protein
VCKLNNAILKEELVVLEDNQKITEKQSLFYEITFYSKRNAFFSVK